MQIKVRKRFLVPAYGTAPCEGYDIVFEKYVINKADQALYTFAEQNKNKGQTAEHMISEIMSVFHRDSEGKVFLGSWMVKRCFIDAGIAYFNAKKNSDHPNRAMMKEAVKAVDPYFIHYFDADGKRVEQPVGVRKYACSRPRNFFKAYEWLPSGTEFEFTVIFDDDAIAEELAFFWIDKANRFGAFPERFSRTETVSKQIV
jgi:hypothetical protein